MKNKKFIFIILFLLLVVGVVILVVKARDDSNALQSSEAAGFGSSATTDNFGNVFNAFSKTPCEGFLELTNFNLLPEGKSLTTMNTIRKDPQALFPVTCVFSFNNGKQVTLELHTYDKSSKIDNTQQDLFNRINSSTMGTVIASGDLGYQNTYFFGTDKNDPTKCRSNIYNGINDFEYGTLVYQGFGNCNSFKNLNSYVSTIFGGKAAAIIEEP